MQNLEQEVGSWDSVLLENLSEDNFISNLHYRYKRDHIYTYIGTFLVAINPYKPLLLYTPDIVRTYATRGLFKLPPHIYAIANSAYQWLLNYNEDQCIILSGESGSGKTETSRMCVHFLTQVSDIRKEPKLPRQRSSNSFTNTKLSSSSTSQPSSKTSTPRHTLSSSQSSSSQSQSDNIIYSVEKIGCLVKKSAGFSGSSGNITGGSSRKCSHEKTVEFDFSHYSSSENLATSQSNRCQKHLSTNKKSQLSSLGHMQSILPCSKHNNIKFDSSSSSSSLLSSSITSTTLPRTQNSLSSKCNSCQHHLHQHNTSPQQILITNINDAKSLKQNEHHPKACNKYSQLQSNNMNKKSCINSSNCNPSSSSTTIECDCSFVTKISSATRTPPILSKKLSKINLLSPKLLRKSYSLSATTVGSGSRVFNIPPKNNEYIDNIDIIKIKEKISQADILLEALGNATTIKNSNSSRFGKFFDIEFDFKGDPIGGQIIHYMLEKSRVTHLPTLCERNFHIFYQLLAGSDIQFLKSLKLQRNVDKYELLKNGLPTEDDKKNFLFTKNSLEILNFTQDEIYSLFKIIAVVIKLGNINFIPSTNIDGTESCAISNEYEMHEISQILNLDYSILINCLTRGDANWNQLDAGPELDATSASRIKNILCRTLYGRLFTWTVNRINESIKIKHQYARGRNLGILDFYGFEILEKNSFEQLAINYCNERLHQNFLQNVLKFEQELYIREGLEWQRIDYFDNETICELIDKSNYGIFSLLDEPQVTTDETLFTRIYQCCSGHTNFLSKDSKCNLKSFQIRHYAGQVIYSVENFMEKNLDILPKNISSCLYQSKLSIVQILFPEGNPKRGIKKPSSLGSNLRRSLTTLMTTLNNRRNHYVFCIKPNESKQQRFFELALVQHQIRYMNLMPLTNLWRNGHYFHITHLKFLNRYKILSPITWPHFDGETVIEGIAIIIRSIPLPVAEFSIGLNHVFIRSPRTVFELEDFRKSRLDYLATYIQKTFRCYSKRKLFLKMRKSQIIISSAWRTWRECRFGIPFTGRRHMWGLYRVAREEYRITKYRKQVEWAVGVIQRSYVQWKRRQFLFTLTLRLPPDTMSPLCFDWPVSSRYLTETSQLLRNIYHRWRCYKYRKSFDQTSRNRMREKVTASIIFKDRKISYIKSVSHPFLGDYVRIRQNIQWKKISIENNDQYVVFADIINKITRSSGKFVPILLVLSTSSMLLLDQRTLQVKYRVPATEIYRLSLSPYLDDIAVFHVKASELGKKKGDFVFQTGHVIEIVTKLFLVVQNATSKAPEVHISTEFEANFGQQTVLFSFKCGALPEIPHGQPKVTRKPNRMEIIV